LIKKIHEIFNIFQFDEEADPLEAKNLFNMQGHNWKEMRTKLSPTFTSGRMKAMFPLVMECATQLEEFMEGLAKKGDEFEAKVKAI
jgi:cytochrome P450